MNEFSLRLENVSKEYEDVEKKKRVVAVDNVTFSVKKGELITLLGPSGCGKTTTLRMIAGFEVLTKGKIYFGDKLMGDTPANKRNTSMVFQTYALFPHMSVYENIAYGLTLKKVPREEIKKRVKEKMKLLELEGFENRAPSQLSGGQQQRVALSRAIINEPELLLFDEPLSNLDAKLRVQTRSEIRKLQRRLKITSVYVTHDQEEAMSISDRVIIMNKGKIEQVSTPEEIYAYPESYFVADFIGKANLIPGTVKGREGENLLVSALGKNLLIAYKEGIKEGEKVTLVVRPEGIDLKEEGKYEGIIRHATYLGSEVTYEVEVGEKILTVMVANPQERGIFSLDEKVGVSFHERGIHLLRSSATREGRL